MMTFKNYMVLAVVTGVISSATALAGTWLGAYLTERRLRKQRILELSLAWHEEIVVLLRRLSVSANALVTLAQQGRVPDGNDPLLAELYEDQTRLIGEGLAKSHLYARRRSADALNALIESFKLSPDVKPDRDSPSSWITLLLPLVTLAPAVSRRIAQDMREALGIDPLPDDQALKLKKPNPFRRIWARWRTT